MKVYSCSGFAFEEFDGGVAYFRTKAEALQAARDATAPDEGVDSGSEASVDAEYVIAPVNAERVVGLLNHTKWCAKTEHIATVRNGRVVSKET